MKHQNRIYSLDVVRGLAAVLVIIHHCFRATPGFNTLYFKDSIYHPYSWTAFIFLGSLAVTTFFILSGASFGVSLKGVESFKIKSFYVKRFFRIYPLYVLSILIYFAFSPIYEALRPFEINDWLSPQFTNEPGKMAWLTYLTMTFNIFKTYVCFNNVLWSLPIEMQFYLFFPLFIFLIKQFKERIGIILIILLCVATYWFAVHYSIPGKTLRRLWEFAGGFILGFKAQELRKIVNNTVIYIGIIISAIGTLIFARNMNFESFGLPYNFDDVVIGFLLILICFRFMSWKPSGAFQGLLLNLGNYSYSMYLIHSMVIGLFAPIFYRFIFNIHWIPFFILLFACCLPVTYWISKHIFKYETFFIGRGRKIASMVN